jgi:glycosyltransferase involved in cell wall biosynthesis
LPPSTLSVAIITLNEEANLPRSLASVPFADEIVIVDCGSTDRTVEIAQSFNAKVFTESWRGFSEQKNLSVDLCSSTWVLHLDADEELTPALQTELRSFLQSDAQTPSPIDAYRLRTRNMFLQRWIRHGGYYPDARIRLFRRNDPAAPSPIRFGKRIVHESIHHIGSVGTLRSDVNHYGYPTLGTYIEHMNRYSSLGSQLTLAKGKISRSSPAFFANIFLVPCLTFLWNFLFRLGFLDGREGLLLHLYHSAYISWKYAKAWDLSRRR